MEESTKDARTTLIDALTKLAEECDVGQAFNEQVIDGKKVEAQAINRSGLRRQVEYLVSRYAPSQTEQCIEDIEGTILDNSKRGKTVSCSICEGVEFESRAHVKGRQQFICRHCFKQGHR
jgi:hypothetical protein